jgi:pimeloyl-ACP methyl ester carboxylesterase
MPTTARQVLIVHGWSDSSKSFHALARFLRDHGYDARLLWLGDYISRDDDLRIEDVARRMGEVIDERIAAGQLDGSFDMIVHSTGGLVARAWLTTRYRGQAERCPMRRLVMLAPANYGSKLAATGKSLLGRVVKGYDNWFQTGQHILDDLELASAYQWELTQRDVLIAPGGGAERYYGMDRVWPFVVVGTHPYTSFLRQITNENGGDGTVRVCAANLNSRGVTIDFSRPNPQDQFLEWGSRLECDAPLAVLPTRTHGSIIDPDRSDAASHENISESDAEKAQLGALLLEALGCADFDAYQGIQQRWNAISEQTAERSQAPPAGSQAESFHQYLQMNAYVVDNDGKPVEDYFLEFFSNTNKAHEPANVYLHGHVLRDVKINSLNRASRNLYFDRSDLFGGYYELLPRDSPPVLYMSISAAAPGRNVSYFEREKIGAQQWVPVHLQDDRTRSWLRRNTTHFVQMIIPRMPASNVFKLTQFAGG